MTKFRTSITVIVDDVCKYLSCPDRFITATLFRRHRTQALALFGIPSASLENASGRGLVDLLDFRLRHATIPIGSVGPLDALLWTLFNRQVQRADRSVLHLEWWGLTGSPFRADGSDTHPTMTLATAAVAKSLRRAAAAGHVHVLAWWRHHSPQLLVSGIQSAQLRFAIRSAAANGHVPVLEWCWEHYPDALEQRKSSLEAAADANQAAVVRWFEAIGTPLDEILSLNFSDGALQLAHLVRKRDAGIVIDHQRDATLSTAYNYAQTEVLRWLRDNGVEDVGDGLPDFATSFGQVEVLRWWKREFQPAIGESPPPFFVRVAYYQGYADVLEFWLESGGLGNPLDGRILLAARKGQVAVFEFIAKRGYRMDQSTADQVSEQASENGRVGLLQWLRDNHFPVRFAPETVANACEFGRLDVLDWWKSNGHPFVFDATWSKNGVLFLSRANRDLLDWWENSGLYVQWPSTVNLLSVFSTSSLGKVDALQWWWDKMPKQSPSAGDFLLGVAGDDDSLGWTDETPVVEMADIEWCRRNGLELPARFLSDESLKVRRWKEEVEHVKKFGDTGRSD